MVDGLDIYHSAKLLIEQYEKKAGSWYVRSAFEAEDDMRLIIAAVLLIACVGCQHTGNRSPSESVRYDPVSYYPQYHRGRSYHRYHQTR